MCSVHTHAWMPSRCAASIVRPAGAGLERADVLEADGAGPTRARRRPVVVERHVEVVRVGCADDDVEPGVGEDTGVVGRLPHHDVTVGRLEPAVLGNLLPRPDLPAGDASHRRDHVGHERGLDGVRARQSAGRRVRRSQPASAPTRRARPRHRRRAATVSRTAPPACRTPPRRTASSSASPGQSELSTKRCTLCAPVASSGSRSDGTAVSAAWQWPGRSTSGTITTPSSRARSTHAADLVDRVAPTGRRGRRAEQRRDRRARGRARRRRWSARGSRRSGSATPRRR